MSLQLFWSKRGDVACEQHAPAADSPRWHADGWQPIAPIKTTVKTRYQCDRCRGTGVAHLKRDGSVRQKGARPPARPSLPEPRVYTSLVLNVDDRPAQLYAREKALRAGGFAVINAFNASDALRLARSARPDLILLDVRMADAEGRELCQRIKADPELEGVAIVLISAAPTTHAAFGEAVRWPGADACVPEPVAGHALAATLRSVLATT